MAAFPADFIHHARRLGLNPCLDPAEVLGRPLAVAGRTLENRICALPMEGWDADADGHPGELTRMRWRRYGLSGAALVWGEAVAVLPEGRAHGQQVLLDRERLPAVAELVRLCREARRERFGAGAAESMLVGIQLNHAGRFSRPDPLPVIHATGLDDRTRVPASAPLLSDADLDRVVDALVEGAVLAREAGFDFVDLKLCHLYLGHELLCARDRPGAYGGDLEGRSRYFFKALEGVRAAAPDLTVATRLSLFEPAHAIGGTPDTLVPFGAAAGDPGSPDLTEPIALVRRMVVAGVRLVGTTLGSPYTTAWLVRPARGKATGENRPPEPVGDGVARHLELAGGIKAACPEVHLVAPGVTALREAAPLAAAGAIEAGLADLVGLGRGLLACPEWPARVLAGDLPRREETCMTCAACTDHARRGEPAGCYAHDAVYREGGGVG